MSLRVKRFTRVAAAGMLLAGISSAVPAAHAAQPRAGLSTYTIGLSLPYLELKQLAVGIQNGVTVAVNQANASHLVPGVTFKVEALDDTVNGVYSGAKDAQNARQFINNSSVIGEVGPLNSGAARVSMPVYNAAGLVQISPSNTAVDLTDPKSRAKYEPSTVANAMANPITYFRTCTTDAYQGPSAALYAKRAGFKTVFVTDNQDTYGVGLAAAFKAEAQKIGLTVLGSAELDANNIATSAQSLASSIAAKKPDLVYFGGEYGAGGGDTLADDIKKAGLTTVFMGGDGIYASDFIADSSAGGVLNGLATSVGGDPAKDPNATAFLKAEAKAYPGSSVQAYDTYSYDAANILLHAFAQAVSAGKIKSSHIHERTRHV